MYDSDQPPNSAQLDHPYRKLHSDRPEPLAFRHIAQEKYQNVFVGYASLILRHDARDSSVYIPFGLREPFPYFFYTTLHIELSDVP